jgi:hypothetical protein
VNYYDLDSLRLLARQHHDLRLREADAERLARELRGTPQRRPRLRLTVSLALGARHRLRPRRLET